MLIFHWQKKHRECWFRHISIYDWQTNAIQYQQVCLLWKLLVCIFLTIDPPSLPPFACFSWPFLSPPYLLPPFFLDPSLLSPSVSPHLTLHSSVFSTSCICKPYTFTRNFPSILSSFLPFFLPSFNVLFFTHCSFFINITQGMAAIMPAMVIVGLAKTIHTLYMGLTLFCFGKSCLFDDT